MANRYHVEWLREGVRQWNKRRKKVYFLPDLSGVDFKTLLPPDFRDSPKTSRYFEKINLEGANLSEADLSNLNFAFAKFDRSNLQRANLSLTNFTGASFLQADLSFAVAENSDFSSGDFRQAKIASANIKSSNFNESVLLETDLTDDQLLDNITTLAIRSAADFLIRAAIGQLTGSKEQGGFQKKEERSRKDVVDVLYATNRVPVFERGKLVDFTGDRATELRYGVCEVIVPKPKPVGSIGSRVWRILRNSKPDEMRLLEVIDYSEEIYWEHWAQTYWKMSDKAEPTLFIHGYNHTFRQAVERAAKICSRLGLGQGIGLFSWPSKGRLIDYLADQSAADASKLYLISFIESFVSKHPARKINIVAHSMGCRLLISALETMANKGSVALANISNVVLVAADFDTGVMGMIGNPIVGSVQRMTNYASEADLALLVSGGAASFPRIGYLPPVYILNGMDTVVVDGEDGSLIHHGYIDSARIISDIFYLIKAKLPPSSRHSLKQVIDPVGIYWRMED